MLIKIEQIRIDGGTQQRAEINNDAVTEYAEAMTNGAKFPPVTVIFDGLAYWLVDGFHRYHAAVQAGFLDIEADVKNGSQRFAVMQSLGANHTHGLRRTNADKKKAAFLAINDAEWGKLSNREIAKICQVSESLVRASKEMLSSAFKTQPIPLQKHASKNPTKDVRITPAEYKNEEPKEPQSIKNNQAPVVQNNLSHENDGAPTDYTELDHLRDQNAELQELVEAMRTDLCAAGIGDIPAAELIAELRRELKNAKLEIKAVTNSRNQLMNENAELKKQCIQQRRMLDKFNKK